jgi:hypothetical protein
MTKLRDSAVLRALLLVLVLQIGLPFGAHAQSVDSQDPPVPHAAGDARATVSREPYREPWKMALRSLLIPGWGQHGIEEPGRGYAFTLAAVSALLLATGVISFGQTEGSKKALEAAGWIGYGFVAGISAYDAWSGAENLNRENGYELGRSAARPGVRLHLIRVQF